MELPPLTAMQKLTSRKIDKRLKARHYEPPSANLTQRIAQAAPQRLHTLPRLKPVAAMPVVDSATPTVTPLPSLGISPEKRYTPALLAVSLACIAVVSGVFMLTSDATTPPSFYRQPVAINTLQPPLLEAHSNIFADALGVSGDDSEYEEWTML